MLPRLRHISGAFCQHAEVKPRPRLALRRSLRQSLALRRRRVAYGKIVLCGGQSLRGGLREPLLRLRSVAIVQRPQPQRVLRIGIARRRGACHPAPCQRLVTRHAFAMQILQGEAELRRSEILRGGFFVIIVRLRPIAVIVLTAFICQGEVKLPHGIILCGGIGEAFGRLLPIDGINTAEKILRRGITFRSQFFQYPACAGAGFHQAERIMSLFCPITNLCQMSACRKCPFIFYLI